jgi:hypothetical protein
MKKSHSHLTHANKKFSFNIKLAYNCVTRGAFLTILLHYSLLCLKFENFHLTNYCIYYAVYAHDI